MKKLLLLILIISTKIISAQVANQPGNIELCDENNDGIECVDLSFQIPQILGSQNPSDYSVTFHASQSDANDDLNPLPIPYCSSSAETIFVRVEDNASGGAMFDTTSFDILLNAEPTLTNSSFSYVFCEFDSDNTGQFNFDTITATLNLLHASQNSNDFTVTYHATVSNAMNNSSPLANGYENTSDPNTVFIRVTNNISGCFNGSNIATLQLIVESAPTAAAPPTFELCADDSSDQDSATFDLTSLDASIIGGQVDISVSYYETAADAMATTNAISSSSSYTNTSNPQTVYARTQNIINGCYSNVVTVTLRVNPLPVVTLPEDTIRCVDNTGMLINPFDIGTDLGPGHSYQWTTPQGMATTPTVTVTEAGTYSLIVTDNNNSTSCSYSDSITITGDAPPCSLSVEEVTTSNIVMYPNPVQNELILKMEANTQVERLEMYSVNGKLIHQENVTSGNDAISIDVHNFTAGFYILKIHTKNKGTLTKQFIVE